MFGPVPKDFEVALDNVNEKFGDCSSNDASRTCVETNIPI